MFARFTRSVVGVAVDLAVFKKTEDALLSVGGRSVTLAAFETLLIVGGK